MTLFAPLRTSASALLLLIVTSNTSGAAPTKATPASPGAFSRGYKLDARLTDLAARGGSSAATPVIVELLAGAQLPPDFKKYARSKGKLGIINAELLDLPNSLLNQLASTPAVFRLHYDRPAGELNYITSLATGTRVV